MISTENSAWEVNANSGTCPDDSLAAIVQEHHHKHLSVIVDWELDQERAVKIGQRWAPSYAATADGD